MPEPIFAQEENKVEDEKTAKLIEVYGDEETFKYAQATIQQVNRDLEIRESNSLVFNGISYSRAYEYNQRKAINYAPPRNPKDDREVSFGIPHEKIIGFCALFLKYVWKRQVKCYDENGNQIERLGDIYDLAIEFSYQLEQFKKKIALIYWEVFTQGNAFVMEDWEVRLEKEIISYFTDDKGNEVVVNKDNMDYSYEFLEGLKHKDGDEVQKRRAVSRILDGRQVIFGNPEIEDVQDQPRLTIEENYTHADAEAIFGSLSRWSAVPKSAEEVLTIVGEKTTLFNAERLKNPKDQVIVHRYMDKENNRYNIFANGVMLLPKNTPFTLFYPRNNYNLTNIPAERLRGSIYARAIPAKTKFNADFIDWALKMLANKFEQGIDPAIFSKGKYTLTRQMFRAGTVTHGVSTADFEKADPDNKGITAPEFSFVNLLKQIIESQTLNPTSSGELSPDATATEISITEANQRDKLGYMLDGLMNGFMDMALRRSETIESKYTIKQKETIVNGKKVPVYQNFTVSVGGTDHSVMFDEEVGGETYDFEGKRDELFQKSFLNRKKGVSSEYYLANPNYIRQGKYNVIIDIMPEKVKDSQLQMMQMWDEFGKLMGLFGSQVNPDTLKQEYLKVSGRPDNIFISKDLQSLEQQIQAQDQAQGGGQQTGSMGKSRAPTVRQAVAQEAMSK